MAQAVIGIMMYVNGSGNEPMNGQAMMDRPVDRNTTESDATGESSKSSTAATDDSTAETTPNDTQSSMADGPNGSGTPGRCQVVAVSKAEILLQVNSSIFIKG